MIQSLAVKLMDFLLVILLLFINFSFSDFPAQFKVQLSDTKISESTGGNAEDEGFKNIVKKRYSKGEELYKNGNYKKAIEEFEDLLSLIETEPEMKKDYDETKVYVAKAKEKLGNLIDSHLNKAKQSKKLSEIIRELKTALNIDPELTEAKKLLKDTEAKITEEVSKLYFKGVDLYSADKLYEAIKIWKEALELKPEHARIKKDLARAESKLQLLNK